MIVQNETEKLTNTIIERIFSGVNDRNKNKLNTILRRERRSATLTLLYLVPTTLFTSLSPNVIKVLGENFDTKPISAVVAMMAGK